MNKNESNERFDEVKAKMDDASKALEKGLETAKAVGAEAGERFSKFLGEAKKKYGPKFEEAKKKGSEKFEDLKKSFNKFMEDVEERKEVMKQEKALQKVNDKLEEAEAFFDISKTASERGQTAYQEAVEAQKEYDEIYGTSKEGKKETKKETKKEPKKGAKKETKKKTEE